MELADFRSKRLAVGVAGGLRKVEAILGALAGRYCNVLITDAATAGALLRRYEAGPEELAAVRERQEGGARLRRSDG